MIHTRFLVLLVLCLQPWVTSLFKVIVENQKSAPIEDENTTVWEDVSEIPHLDCPIRWSCRDYNHNKTVNSLRSHYYDRNCACDPLCILLEDCCHDVQLLPMSSTEYEASGESLVAKDGSVGRVASNQQPGPTKDVKADLTSFLQGPTVPSDYMLGNMSKSNLSQYFKVFAKYDLSKDMFSCVPAVGISEVNMISLVTECPQHHDDPFMAQMCHNVSEEDMLTSLPVSGKVTKVLYRNMYCAMCHQEPFVFWAAGIQCHSRHVPLPYDYNTSLSEIPLNSSQCEIFYKPPSDLYQWRPCVRAISQCCTTCSFADTPVNKQIAARCEETDNPTQRLVYSFTNTYRNQYCAMCNQNDIRSLSCLPLTMDTISQFGGATRSLSPYSFSILLDINTNSGSVTVGKRFEFTEVKTQEVISCEEGQVYDPFQGVCRQVACGPGRGFFNKICQKITSHQKGDGLLNNTMKEGPSVSVENCSYVELNSTEYELFDNGTLFFLSAGVYFNSSFYVIENDAVFLCLNFSRNHTWTTIERQGNFVSSFSMLEAVVSMSGLCISLLALTVTIIVYGSLRPLRNIPGQNLMSLVSALFLADLLLLLAPAAGASFLSCAVVAGIMHYFFLASFMWMNVMALDVWFAFSKAFVKAGDRGKSSKRFLMYSAYAWLTPLVFVASAALLQVLLPDSIMNPRYGLGICWLTNKNALSLFFAAPLFFLLLLNTVFFIISARNISRAKRTTARMLGREDEGKMAIYVKLTVVMGITWILGFLAALVPGSQVLLYSFIVMNTLQGLFISISFVCTDKVTNLLKNKLCKRKELKSMKSASTDMTTASKSLSGHRKSSTVSAKSHNVLV